MRNQHIPTTAAPLPFTPPSILATERTAEPGEPPFEIPVFLVKPMTEAEFDRLGYELFRHNLVPPSQDSFRALTITELFELHGDEKGEELAGLLDAYWQSEDAHRDQMGEWHEQERQRMLDDHLNGTSTKPMPLPQKLMGLKDRHRALQVAEHARIASPKIRDLTIEMQSYEPIQRAGLARLVVLGWTGLDTIYVSVDGIIPEDVYAALRAEIGKQAIAELETFVASLGSLSETEKGNSESPPPTEPIPQLSPAPNGEDSAGDLTSAAASTDSSSNSEATLVDGSDETTGESSISTSGSAGDTPSTNDTPAEA